MHIVKTMKGKNLYIIVALGGNNHATKIEDKDCFTKIKEYVNQRV